MAAANAVLVRILGNDLPPRHAEGQTLANLRFILAEESPLPGLEKRWLLNRIVDPEREQMLRDAIERAGQRCDVIPFCPREYRQAWMNLGAIPAACHPWSPLFQQLTPLEQARVRDYIGRAKNLYLMNNNGARNLCLRQGFADGAGWVLPWDGGCFLQGWAWDEIQSACQQPGVHYVCVPMHRLGQGEPMPSAQQRGKLQLVEPQLCFSREAKIGFDSELRYGSGPKWQVLKRLGVPGPWQESHGWLPWEQVDTSAAPDAGAWLETGLVLRLSGAEQDHRHVEENALWRMRFAGILRFTREVDCRLLRECLARPGLRFWTPLQQAIEAGAIEAGAVVRLLPKAGVGQRAVWAGDLFALISWLALDGVINGKTEARREALTLVSRFCLESDSALILDDQPLDWVCELGSFVPLLDALTLLNSAELFTPHQWEGVLSWCENVLEWLLRDSQILLQDDQDRRVTCWHHLLTLAAAAFLGRVEICAVVIDNLPALPDFDRGLLQSAPLLNRPMQQLMCFAAELGAYHIRGDRPVLCDASPTLLLDVGTKGVAMASLVLPS